MIWLLLILGILTIGFLHLIIPVCVAISRKPLKKSGLWLIAAIGGLVGFVICAILQEEFRGVAGLIQSAFWTLISFFILKKRCYVKRQVKFCSKCGNKLEDNSLFCDKCGTEINKEV
jgi:hypothetical protein